MQATHNAFGGLMAFALSCCSPRRCFLLQSHLHTKCAKNMKMMPGKAKSGMSLMPEFPRFGDRQ